MTCMERGQWKKTSGCGRRLCCPLRPENARHRYRESRDATRNSRAPARATPRSRHRGRMHDSNGTDLILDADARGLSFPFDFVSLSGLPVVVYLHIPRELERYQPTFAPAGEVLGNVVELAVKVHICGEASSWRCNSAWIFNSLAVLAPEEYGVVGVGHAGSHDSRELVVGVV
ncbi:hypothetical protein C8J57DRAFT_1530770 [Mycena rebaudengoi]|nr:hypothetical protein C8J57DRAFT_1530770 [Mycena rebaudengoi]